VILDLFVTRKVNPYGLYAIKLNIDGEWKVVCVDDYIPIKWGKPVFSKSQNQDLWVILLEKAWAKVCGSYQSIESGVAKEVLKLLSGAPTEFFLTKEEDFITKLEECAKQKCIMVSGSFKEASKLTGLVPGHAYSILKVKDIVHPKVGNVKLVKLRNPWADKEWKYTCSLIF
jgi:calpain-15